MKLLIVDDDQSVHDSLVISLRFQRRSFELLHAFDGRKALSCFFEEEPDLVLLDLGLPGMNGLDVLQRIRAVSKTPVIILSARGGEADVIHGLELGADDYIRKPFGAMELLARIGAQAR